MNSLLSFILGALLVAGIGSAIYFYQMEQDKQTITSLSDGISDIAKSIEEKSQ